MAEVLITLTIIGVIAAITIPNLIQNYKKHQVEVGVKEAYSILSNAIKMSIIDHGPVSEWPNLGNPKFAPEYIIPYLKTTELCGSTLNTHLKKNTCFTKTGSPNDWYLLNGNIENFYLKSNYDTMKLANGMELAVFSPYNNAIGPVIEFVVDINGSNRGPSKMGVDIFKFMLVKTSERGQHLRAYDYAYYAEGANGTSMSGALSNTKYGCNLQANGYYCTRVLEANGWKIPDDYPVKKF